MHVHLRQGDMLRQVISFTAVQCRRALAMPNTIPPILTAEDVRRYREEIEAASPKEVDFEPLMTFKVTQKTSPSMVKELTEAGVLAGKLYPEGVTTNSEDGVTDILALAETFHAMAESSIVLCIHGEVPGVFSLDREAAFIEILNRLAQEIPSLRIVLEHVSCAAAVKAVQQLGDNVAATITAHHLCMTLEDVIGNKLMPHNFCKPILKRPEDRDALRAAATSGSPKFFLGSDSAPHTVSTKECDCGAAGIYSAPVLLPLLAQIFEEENALDKLEKFTSEFGASFYGLPLNEEYLELISEPYTVPASISDVVPFKANDQLSWRLS